MKTSLYLLCFGCLSLSAAGTDQARQARFRSELMQAEARFCAQAESVGIAEAFAANMADQCFMPGQFSLTKAEYLSAMGTRKDGASNSPKARLTWRPLMAEASEDGTLGYTWGRYEYRAPDAPDGKAVQPQVGLYLTIWKRQPDGSWKFVFDGSPQTGSPEQLSKFLSRPELTHVPAVEH